MLQIHRLHATSWPFHVPAAMYGQQVNVFNALLMGAQRSDTRPTLEHHTVENIISTLNPIMFFLENIAVST